VERLHYLFAYISVDVSSSLVITLLPLDEKEPEGVLSDSVT
jgi:hypothetical protein